MEAELKELKSVLKSLVVSSPTQVDVRTLVHDYRSMMGTTVPVAKYGYKNLLEFLKERCSDCFLLTGQPANPVLTLIVPDTLKHIDNFVKKQKVSSTAKIKGKRRSVSGSNSPLKNNDAIVNSFKTFKAAQESTKLVKESQTNNLTENTYPLSIKDNNFEVDKMTEKVNRNNEMSENVQLMGGNTIIDEIDGGSNCSSAALNNFLKKRLPLYNGSIDIENHSNEQTTSKDDDSGRQTSSSTSSTKMIKLERLKIEITDLLADHPDGIWCTDFIRLYREKYDKDVNFTWFGYTSILSLLFMLEDIVTVTRPLSSGDWLVVDARTRPPTVSPAAPLRVPRRTPRRDPHCDPDDALPGISYDPDVFPEDCMHYMESLPSMSMQGLDQGMMLEVIVGEVYSPSHFWLIRLGDDYNIAMEDVMDEMTEYYERGAGRGRRLACGAVRVGHYCASVYEGDWHRALVVQVLDADTVKVRHVDYGTVETCASGSLRPLLRRWARLPAQAVRARLAGVRPCGTSRQWPRAAAAHFLRAVRDARLVAYVAALDEPERALCVQLIDTTGEEDVYVAAELVRAGHADQAAPAPRDSKWHLYPRFEALESGAAPSYAELHAYLRDGIALQYVDAYRRHALLSEPPSPAPSPAPSPSPSPAPSPSPCPAPSPSPSPAPSPPPPPDAPACPRPQVIPQPVQPYHHTFPQPQPAPVVQLSVAECEMFRRLSLEDAAMAHRFMVHAISCALAALDAPAPPWASQPSQPPQPLQHTQPPLRPPPGFEP